MAIIVEPKHRATSGSTTDWSIGYLVIADGADADLDEFGCKAAIANEALDTIEVGDGFVLLNDVTIEEYFPTPSCVIAFGTAKYGIPEQGSLLNQGNTTPPSGVEATTEFSYDAPSETLYYALSTTKYPGTLPDVDHRIRVDFLNDGETQGISIAAKPTHQFKLTVPRGFVSPTYESIVESLIGKTNSVEFKGRPIGTMRFVGCTSSLNLASNQVDFWWGMQYSANRTSVTLAGHSGVNIDGHQVWWPKDRREINGDNITIKTEGIYVQTVFESGDLNQLF